MASTTHRIKPYIETSHHPKHSGQSAKLGMRAPASIINEASPIALPAMRCLEKASCDPGASYYNAGDPDSLYLSLNFEDHQLTRYLKSRLSPITAVNVCSTPVNSLNNRGISSPVAPRNGDAGHSENSPSLTKKIQTPPPPLKLRFDSGVAPLISLEMYLERLKLFYCSRACFVLAVIYVDRLHHLQSLNNPRFQLNHLNIHRILLTALTVATKYLDDIYFTNEYYAKIGGITCTDLSYFERYFLHLIQFDLYVSPADYIEYVLTLRGERTLPVPLTCRITDAARRPEDLDWIKRLIAEGNDDCFNDDENDLSNRGITHSRRTKSVALEQQRSEKVDEQQVSFGKGASWALVDPQEPVQCQHPHATRAAADAPACRALGARSKSSTIVENEQEEKYTTPLTQRTPDSVGSTVCHEVETPQRTLERGDSSTSFPTSTMDSHKESTSQKWQKIDCIDSGFNEVPEQDVKTPTFQNAKIDTVVDNFDQARP